MTRVSPSLTRAVAASLKDAQVAPRDAAAVALVKRYAGLIERAAVLAEEAARLAPVDEDTAQAIARIRAAVHHQVVVSDLGPKLLTALAALGMTPAARGSATKGGPGESSERSDPLADLRARAAARRPR